MTANAIFKTIDTIEIIESKNIIISHKKGKPRHSYRSHLER